LTALDQPLWHRTGCPPYANMLRRKAPPNYPTALKS
jgi:hypothetical protein